VDNPAGATLMKSARRRVACLFLQSQAMAYSPEESVGAAGHWRADRSEVPPPAPPPKSQRRDNARAPRPADRPREGHSQANWG